MICPKCGSEKVYRRSTSLKNGYARFICASVECHHFFSETSFTSTKGAKKPQAWYDRVLALYLTGLNNRAIARAMGMKDAKSIWYFLTRWRAAYASLHD